MDEILMESAETLLSPEWKHALAKRLKSEGVSRMGGFLFLLAMILDFWENGGTIIDEESNPLKLHYDIIEEAYAYELTFSWTTDIRQFAESVPLRGSKKHLLLRLQLWDAAYKIAGDPITID